jgi:hypothetical protein
MEGDADEDIKIDCLPGIADDYSTIYFLRR